jgi:hypothetical protein
MAAAVSADVTVKRQIAFEIMGMPPNEMVSTEQIQGDKSRSQTEFTGGGMMGMTGGQQPVEVNITRLDKGLLWNVNDKANTFYEIDLKNMKNMTSPPTAPAPAEDVPDNYEWTYDVKREDKSTENGFKCKAVITVASGINKNDPDDKVELRYEFWMGVDIPGQEDLDAYNKTYAEVMGMDQFDQDQMIKKMGNEYGPQLKKLAESFKDLDGYPIKTIISTRKSGGVSIPGMPEGKEMDAEQLAMMRKMMGGKEPEASEDGLQTVFSVTTEVVGIDTKAVEAGAFDIPEGYTKQ